MMVRLEKKESKATPNIIRISKENYAMMLDIINKRENPRSWTMNEIFDEILVKAGMKEFED